MCARVHMHVLTCGCMSLEGSGQGSLPGRPVARAVLHPDHGADSDEGRENILDMAVGGEEGRCEGSGRAEEAAVWSAPGGLSGDSQSSERLLSAPSPLQALGSACEHQSQVFWHRLFLSTRPPSGDSNLIPDVCRSEETGGEQTWTDVDISLGKWE